MEKYKIRHRCFCGGIKITFRVWKDGEVDIKLDDTFAFVLGFPNAKEWKKGNSAFVNAIDSDWARVNRGRAFLYGSDGFIPLDCSIILSGVYENF